MQSNNHITCKIKGHNEFSVSHICTYVDCNQVSRLCCLECLEKEVHNHNIPDNNHVMDGVEML